MQIQFFLKFGDKIYMERLRDGELYVKTLADFKKDVNHMRYDKTEGLASIEHIKERYLQLKPKEATEWKNLKVNKGELKYWHDASKVHSYSLFYISEEQTRKEKYFIIPENMKEYGDYYLLITNPKEFITRIQNVLDYKKYKYDYSTISYYDPKENQNKLGFFHKDISHLGEQEFRILIETETLNPLILDMGTLNDISEVIHVNQYSGLQFQW